MGLVITILESKDIQHFSYCTKKKKKRETAGITIHSLEFNGKFAKHQLGCTGRYMVGML